MKRISIVRLALCMLLLGSMVAPSIADTLWYNGDYYYDDNNRPAEQANRYVSNQISPALNARAYDDFVVSASGWTINTLYSNNIVYNSTITEAYWEIRRGMSDGNGGTLLFSGTSSASVVATGRISNPNDNNPEMTVAVDVTGLNLSLAAGTYWLSVTPIISDDNGWAANTITIGLNAFGMYPGNNGNGFACYVDAITNQKYRDGDYVFGWPVDYSMGIEGTVGSSVPIPASILLLASALLRLGAHGFRVRER